MNTETFNKVGNWVIVACAFGNFLIWLGTLHAPPLWVSLVWMALAGSKALELALKR